ncbi:putative proteasome subunit alpha type 6 [Cryptosporidium serpentis]
MSRASQSLHDRHITIFSPEGKLYQIEYAFRAVKNSNLTAIAIKGTDTVCIACQKKVPNQQGQQDKLLDASYVTSMFRIRKDIGAVALGIGPDCKAMISKCREIASDFAFNNGMEMPVSYLCHKAADVNQMYTQHASMRLLGASAIFVSIDDEDGPSIYKVDPAGYFASYKACAIGSKEREGTNILEKILKKTQLSSSIDVVNATIESLQSTLGVDFKCGDIEVGVATVNQPAFRLLSEIEIDECLTTIAEKD